MDILLHDNYKDGRDWASPEKKKIDKSALEKVTDMVGTFLKEDSFGRMIGYSYEQVVSKYVNVQSTRIALEKVADTVATFLNKSSHSNRDFLNT